VKSIKLLNLKLTNFKGIKSFELFTDGKDTKVFGENAVGKTTLFDGFVWLLFNKDSNNNTNFDIKTLDSEGNVIHRLNHEVEANLLINDGLTKTELTLKKVFKEKWTKPRGQIEHVFGGHTTDYYINEVPSKKKEYDDAIAEVVSEDVFKLLTSPSEFNNNLHWTKRRELLLEIAGDITDEDVIKSNQDLAKLLDILNGNSIEDHKKIIAAKRREINERIKEIPTRVDEIHRNMPDLTGLNEASTKTQIDKLSFEIEEKNEQINSIKNGSEVNEIKKKISDIDLQIANVRNEHTQNEQQEVFKLKTKLQEEQSNHQILQNDVRNLMQQQEMNKQRINDFERQMQQLREEFILNQEQYKEHEALQFNHDEECVCPTCEQDLPQDKVDEAVAKFNTNKSDLLEKIKNRQAEINKEGIALKEKVEQLQNENVTLQDEIDKITAQGKKKAEDVKALEEKIAKAESTVKPIEENEQYIKLTEEKQALKNKINDLEQSVQESVNAIHSEVTGLKEQQNKLQINLSKIAQAETSKKRIAELETEEKKLAEEYEELEHQLYLTEEFTRTKVNMLTENINSKFKYARFKLFREQINGGLEEICETTYEGVPYSSGLNNAARINVGLDIINTLSTHYGVQAPIFVDNAESVTKLIDIESQVISLVVSKQDKELRVETKENKESEVA